MKTYTRYEKSWKHRVKENLDIRMQRLFGFVRGFHRKVNQPEAAINLPSYETEEVTRGLWIMAEQEKAEATEFLLRRNLAFC